MLPSNFVAVAVQMPATEKRLAQAYCRGGETYRRQGAYCRYLNETGCLYLKTPVPAMSVAIGRSHRFRLDRPEVREFELAGRPVNLIHSLDVLQWEHMGHSLVNLCAPKRGDMVFQLFHQNAYLWRPIYYPMIGRLFDRQNIRRAIHIMLQLSGY